MADYYLKVKENNMKPLVKANIFGKNILCGNCGATLKETKKDYICRYCKQHCNKQDYNLLIPQIYI